MKFTERMIHNKFSIVLLCCIFSAFALDIFGAVYYTAANGDDSNPGTELLPWRTIQKAADTMGAGDTIIVRSGHYSERVSTKTSGLNEKRIFFKAEQNVIVSGFIINHAYITVDGFHVTGHSAPSRATSFVKLNSGANYFHLLNCSIRDGFAIKRGDMVFIAPNKITTATGGFLDAGFFPGQSIALRRGTNVSLATPQTSNFTVTTVTDTTLTVAESTIVNDGPKPGYITGSPNFGLHLHGSTQNGVFRGNIFTNLSEVFMQVGGRNHLFEENTFEDNNGWDTMILGGSDHVLRRNVFRNYGWGNYSPSPDILDNFGNTKFERITFTNNFIYNIVGVISVQKAASSLASGPLLLARNVFVDVGFFNGRFPNTTIEHNTFLRVARHSSPAVSVTRHALIFDTADFATNATIRNNVFIDCGEATGSIPLSEVGWYQINGPRDSVTAEGNFVAGPQPEFASKVGWPEDPNLNGGDPGFININDPLGPDRIPFTEDDGLRLRADSKLIGAGPEGATPGAYPPSTEPNLPPPLSILHLPGAELSIRWPVTSGPWILQSAPSLTGIWTDVPAVPVQGQEFQEITVNASQFQQFFRLRHKVEN